MAMYKSVLDINGDKKTVVVINHKESNVKTDEVTVESLHHIHILDRSGSMSGEINRLVENVKTTLDAMADNDYVSIIWFSGPGQCKTLIKGARKDESLKKILDTIKSTLSTTCFSEPMKEASTIVDELEVICPNFSITLFTDGEPVVPWSDEEEYNRVFKIIDTFKDKVLAINTIGYRNGYNREFLVNVAQRSQFGMMVHSNDINQYLEIFSHNYSRVSDLIIENVEVSCIGADILYLNRNSCRMNKDSYVLNMLDKKRNQFVIVMNGDDPFKFEFNGETFYTDDITTPVPSATLTVFGYAYSYQLYYLGKRQQALDMVVKYCKDKHLADMQINAYTYDEIASYLKELHNAVFHISGRLIDGKCDDDYLPANDALCVMDVLKELAEGDSFYVYTRDYNRISLKSSDDFNLFKWDEGDILTPISEFVFNKDRLNLSIRSKVPGTVQINPKQADRVQLPKEIRSYVFRNQTVIKDGFLNIPEIKVYVDKDTASNLFRLEFNHKANFMLDDNVTQEINGKTYYRQTLQLNNLPIVNRNYVDSANVDNILQISKHLLDLEAKQKVLKWYLDNSGVKNAWVNTDYTDEQIEVLKDHGLDGNLMYVGVENVKEEKDENDFYLSRVLKFDIKGTASLPSVNQAIKDSIKANPNFGTRTVLGYYNQYQNVNIEDVKTLYELSNKELLSERIKLSSLKIAKILTGDWFEGVTPDGKGNYLYTSGDDTLVIKTDKTKVYY